MNAEFDNLIDRRQSNDSTKWTRYGPDVLPMWIADMDFAVCPEVTDAIMARVKLRDYGYATAGNEVRASIVDWVRQRYSWSISAEDIVFLPGALPGLVMGMKATTPSGGTALVQTPAYGPIRAAPNYAGLKLAPCPLDEQVDGGYSVNSFVESIKASDCLLLCNPHNPTGMVYEASDLERIAGECLTHGLSIVSDEVHCDLTYAGNVHTPIASISKEIADRTITLMSAAKTFNLSGLKFAFAIISNRETRKRFISARSGLVPSTDSLLGLTATKAAFRHGENWRTSLVHYLSENLGYLSNNLGDRLPGVALHPPKSSFLAWLDFSDCELSSTPYEYFLHNAKVAMSPGESFGHSWRDFARINYGCPRAVLEDAIDRMANAL